MLTIPAQMFEILPQSTVGSRRAPDPPRSLLCQAGSLKAVLTWSGPENMLGVDGYRVFVDDDRQLFSTIADPNTKKIEIPLTAGGSRGVAVSCFTKLGNNHIVESPRIPTIATANTDKLVVTGTAGQTSGSSPSSPPEYPSEPSGGKDPKGGSGARVI